MPFDGEESRAAQRVDFVGPAVVKAQGRDVSCTIVNLSSAGMLLIPAASARPGLQMRVVFEVRGLGRLDLEAVLARETQIRGQYGWAVRFVNVPDGMATLLQMYIQRCLAAARSPAEVRPANAEPLRETSSGLYAVVGRKRDKAIAGKDRSKRSDQAAGDRSASSSASGPLRALSSAAYRRVFSSPDSVDSRKQGADASTEQRGPRQAPPSMAGMGAPGGGVAGGSGRQGSETRSGQGSRSTDAAKRALLRESLTGPPRRGAVDEMHQTGPRQAAVGTPAKPSEPARSSTATRDASPAELRRLYQEAVDEVKDAPKGKRKSWFK